MQEFEDKMDKILFWDFHGTLAYNDWMLSKTLYKVLVNNDLKTKISINNFKSTQWLDFQGKIVKGNICI